IGLTGYVEDIRPYVQRAACYVVPLRVGGGTRLKILDAWAMGKAVVSTSIGCEGLDARDGDNVLVRDDPAEFAAAVRQVLDDEGLRARLGEGARRTAEEVYDWEVIGRSMNREYLALLGGRSPGLPAEAVAAARV
ncbi:MAG TPA: glycosyltransferase family 4 protein, partial [Longimicrobiaceae bacterium]|nr:glycosyltransferase family 4 protein [Longimicrobiaceae bacterium]